jgi:hypothetical protein
LIEYFPDATYGLPDEWARRFGVITYHVKKSQSVPGGHFPAYTNPTDLVGEIRKFWGSDLGGWA